MAEVVASCAKQGYNETAPEFASLFTQLPLLILVGGIVKIQGQLK